ncbi:hypothetical protein BJ912DRAFT_1059694 [Pholiota molesta]|nr:hypothetical protein BJ912DRAFT_1059694 [Pholiota molesta]
MPFFGSSKKHDDNMAVAGMDNACAGGRHHVQPTIYSARLRGAGMANGDAFGQTRASAPGPIYKKSASHLHAQDDPYTAGGVGSGRQGSDGRGIQSAGANNHGAAQNLSGDQGSGGRLAGNLEPAAPMVGSEQLKWKRLQKEQAANVFRLRSALAEADPLSMTHSCAANMLPPMERTQNTPL